MTSPGDASGSTSLEIERKYDVDEATPLPQWSALPGVHAVAAPERRDLRAYYFDTVHADLASQHAALRRRTGGPDEGWHLKQSTPEGKLETHWELGDIFEDSVPDHIVDALGLRDELIIIARVENARVAYALTDADGTLVAEFVDDHVSAYDPGRGVESRWREWELELGPAAPTGDERDAFFAAADHLVAQAGGAVSRRESKIQRALGY